MLCRRAFTGVAVAAAVAVVVADYSSLTAKAGPLDGSRLHWVTNGAVTAASVVGDTLYVGGDFTRVGPTSAALGAVYALSTATGAVVPAMPIVDGEVRDVEPDGAGGYYIAGRFSRVGGLPRSYLARVRADGSVDPAFAPAISANPASPLTIESIVLNNGVVYFAIRFASALVNGVARTGLAAVDATNGTTRGFPGRSGTPKVITVNGQVVALGPSVSVIDAGGNVVRSSPVPGFAFDAVLVGSRLILAGNFAGPGFLRARLTALDWATGLPDPSWPPPLFDQFGDARTLTVSGSTLYVGGDFSTFMGQPRANLAAVDVATGALTSWAPAADGIVETLAITAGGILAGGSFLTVDGAPRERIAEIAAAGAVTTWQSAAYATTVHTLHMTAGGTAIVGGRLAINQGVARTKYAAFDLSSDTLLPWAPDLPERNVVALAATATRVFVGTEQASGGQPRIAVVTADTATELPWQPAPPPSRLVGVDGPFVYVTGLGGVVTRTDSETGAPDPWFRTAILPADIVDGIMYGAAPSFPARMIAVHLASATPAPWSVPLVEQTGFAGPGGITLDGSTAYITYDDYAGARTAAFDARSGVPLPWTAALALVPNHLRFARSLTAVDGRVILATSSELPGQGVIVVDAHGQTLDPGLSLTNIPSRIRGARTAFATATDLIVLGVERTSPLVHGLAVIPRTPASGPHALRWSTAGNQVTLSWSPGSPPSNSILTVGTQPVGSVILQLPVGAQTSITAAVASGPYFARVTPEAGAVSTGSNQVAVMAGCAAAPSPPTELVAELIGSVVSFSWRGPSPFTPVGGYVLEAGSRAGATDIGAVSLSPDDTTFSTPAPPGIYYVRTRAVNACGRSPASAEVFVTVGAAEPLPPAPGQPTASVVGQTVTVQWPAVSNASGYVLEAGSAPGFADIAQVRTPTPGLVATGVPPGIYHLRYGRRRLPASARRAAISSFASASRPARGDRAALAPARQ